MGIAGFVGMLFCDFIPFRKIVKGDSLSQSISSTSSATNAGYGARVIGYQDQIKNSLETIKRNQPNSIIFVATYNKLKA